MYEFIWILQIQEINRQYNYFHARPSIELKQVFLNYLWIIDRLDLGQGLK